MLKKIEISYKQKIESIQLVFNKLNLLYLHLKVKLIEIYINQGRLKEVEEMRQQELTLTETTLEKEHPNTLTSINNLVLVLSSQEKYKKAEEIYRQALTLRKTILDTKHPSMLISINNLAEMLSS